VSDDRVTAIERALERAPEDHELRALYADTLADLGRDDDAAREYRRLHKAASLPHASLVRAAKATLASGDPTLAGELLDAAERAGVVEGLAGAREMLTDDLAQRGVTRLHAGAGLGETQGIDLRAEPTVTFADVGGLEDLKKLIHRKIVLPFHRPELFERYGRRAGGGVLLYGPPGVGKTMIARATAGECELPFFNVRVEDIADKWYGNSEQNLHGAFEQARAHAPCVLFLDELDTLGIARSKLQGSSGARPVVNQLLQELDAIGANNEGLLILAATNTPWDVDDALKRPGRFGRVVFVPPPDEAGRQRILEVLLRDLPRREIDPQRLARRTSLFSGADLRALVTAAIDEAIENALDGDGADIPISWEHFEHALKRLRPTTLAWLETARTYVEFADAGGGYEELRVYLESTDTAERRR